MASVTTTSEARIALAGGADIIDLKDPTQGALGALPRECSAQIVADLGASVPLSATIGDLPLQPAVIERAIGLTHRTGVDYVKVGLFPGAQQSVCIDAIAEHTAYIAVIVVLFADLHTPLRSSFLLLDRIAQAGCRGVMLDTAEKNAGSLRAVASMQTLSEFVARSRGLGLLTGLAGSLRCADVGPLAIARPDYLGFRGALCGGGRAGTLLGERVAAVRRALDDAMPPAAVAV